MNGLIGKIIKAIAKALVNPVSYAKLLGVKVRANFKIYSKDSF